MFDLEQSIFEWRKQMLAAGIKTPVPLEELEIHLREEIERQVKSGLNEQNAFEISVQQIGQPKKLEGEFEKVETNVMKPMIKIATGILGLLISAALMTPGCIQLHNELIIANGRLGLWLLGFLLVTWSFNWFRQIIPNKPKTRSEKVEMTLAKRILKISTGIVGLLIGLALVMPAVAQARHEGFMKFDEVCFLVFGVALLVSGKLVTFFPYRKRKA
jgi:hypothetical protein